MKRFSFLVVSLVLSLSAVAQTWTLDKAHARLGFTVEHMMISDVEGLFKSFDAKITAAREDFSDAVIDLTADVSSVNTESEKRDNHLRGPDFFDVAKYPTLVFKSKSLKKMQGKQYKLYGDLTMHGVTKPVVLDVVFRGTTAVANSNNKAAGFKVSGTLKRSDFGIAPGVPTAMLSDEVILTANAEFIGNFSTASIE